MAPGRAADAAAFDPSWFARRASPGPSCLVKGGVRRAPSHCRRRAQALQVTSRVFHYGTRLSKDRIAGEVFPIFGILTLNYCSADYHHQRAFNS